jgi:hypothetical protein
MRLQAGVNLSSVSINSRLLLLDLSLPGDAKRRPLLLHLYYDKVEPGNETSFRSFT